MKSKDIRILRVGNPTEFDILVAEKVHLLEPRFDYLISDDGGKSMYISFERKWQAEEYLEECQKKHKRLMNASVVAVKNPLQYHCNAEADLKSHALATTNYKRDIISRRYFNELDSILHEGCEIISRRYFNELDSILHEGCEGEGGRLELMRNYEIGDYSEAFLRVVL